MHKLLLFFFLLIFIHLFAQQPAKKALSIDDFADWETVASTKISNDGKYI